MFRLILIALTLMSMTGCGIMLEPPRVVVTGPHYGPHYRGGYYRVPQHHQQTAHYNPGLAERIYQKCSGNQTCMHGEWHKIDAQGARMRYRYQRRGGYHHAPRYVQSRRGYRGQRHHRVRQATKRHRRGRRR